MEHGWWDKEPTFGELVALMHSELSEALEEYRAGRPMVYFMDVNGFVVSDMSDRRGEKLEGIAVELADCIIRILDWAGKEGLDMDAIIREKMEYNKTRPYRHGGKVLRKTHMLSNYRLSALDYRTRSAQTSFVES